MNTKKSVRCAVYTRVSTDEQAQGEYSSLASQRDMCGHAIALHKEDGWFEASYFEDPGYSGKDLQRPAFQALMAAVEAGEVDVVVTYKLDRVSRSIIHFYEFWGHLEKRKVDFLSATQQFDTSSPAGKLMLNMLLSFGQFEREMTAERVADKILERSRRGKWNGGPVPEGYIRNPETKGLEPSPEDSAIIQRVFQMVTELGSPSEVARILNREGVRTKRREQTSKGGAPRQIGGKSYTGARVTRIIGNPTYKGVIRHRDVDYPGEHQAIVSEEVWKIANEALRAKSGPVQRITTARSNKHGQILKGLIYCDHCGYLLTPKASGKLDKHGNPYLYYVCNEVSKDGRAATCLLRNLPAREIEDFIIETIGQIGQHPDVIAATCEAYQKSGGKTMRDLKSKISDLTKKHKAAAEQVRGLLDLAKKKGCDHISRELLTEADESAAEMHLLETQIEKARTELQFLGRNAADERVIAEALTSFKKVFDTLSDDKKAEFLGLILRRVSIRRLAENAPIPKENQCSLILQMRTFRFQVKIQLFTEGLLSTGCETGDKSSYLNQSGDPYGIRTRITAVKGRCPNP